MNFKPTKIKVIVCVFLLILVGVIMSYITSKYFCWASSPLCDELECPPFKDPCVISSPGILVPNFLSLNLIVAVVAYVVWSLVQKKQK